MAAAADATALLAAAVRAAILAKAPRRTVAAVAVAVAGVLVRPTACAAPTPGATRPASTQGATEHPLAGTSPEELVNAIRLARRAQRRRKTERRQATKATAATSRSAAFSATAATGSTAQGPAAPDGGGHGGRLRLDGDLLGKDAAASDIEHPFVQADVRDESLAMPEPEPLTPAARLRIKQRLQSKGHADSDIDSYNTDDLLELDQALDAIDLQHSSDDNGEVKDEPFQPVEPNRRGHSTKRGAGVRSKCRQRAS